ncbi:MAG TPA: ribosome-associated translation inhibitor RaiA [Gammaproteobacteria bacterium]
MMNRALQITGQSITITPAIEAHIRGNVEKLCRYRDDIVGCRVVIDSPHRHHAKGRHYEVRINLTVPGAELAVTHEPRQDLYLASKDAFTVARRQLLAHLARQRNY